MSNPTPATRPLARKELARLLDHTRRGPEATAREIDVLCAEARAHGFFSVCVNSSRVTQAAALVEGSDAKVTCAVGFPFGAADTDVKRFETEVAIDHGAHIIELSANVGLVKDGNDAALLRELRDIVEAADERPVSIGIDLQLLSPPDAERLCHIAIEAGVKGATLVAYSGASTATIVLKQIAAVAGDNFGLKLDCQSLTRDEIVSLLDAGATRFGLVGGVRLLESL